MRAALVLAGVGEGLTGLLLVLAPGAVARLLLGTDLTDQGAMIARVAGIALLGLGAACWPGPASLGMQIYGLLVALYLAWLGLTLPQPGILLWPAVVLHAALTVAIGVQDMRGRWPPTSR